MNPLSPRAWRRDQALRGLGVDIESLSIHARNIMHNAMVNGIDIRSASYEEILSDPNCGPRTAMDIWNALHPSTDEGRLNDV